jgi:soluble lytic murein transglycosylase-like protein
MHWGSSDTPVFMQERAGARVLSGCKIVAALAFLCTASLLSAQPTRADVPLPLLSPQSANAATSNSAPAPLPVKAPLPIKAPVRLADNAGPASGEALPAYSPFAVPLAVSVPPSAPLSASPKIWSPEILSGRDRELYVKIFDTQNRGRWKQADGLIDKLADKRLMGYVLFQRYLHPRYRSSYAELRAWMAEYADLPDAATIYKLALHKKTRKAAPPNRPQVRHWRQPASVANTMDDDDAPSYSAQFKPIDDKVRELVRVAKARDAVAYLNKASIRRSLSDAEFDKIRERIAASYFIEDDNENAYQTANDIARRHGNQVPLADWYAGLAAWRMEHYDDAARHFARLAQSRKASDWSRAAGGFWAARAYLADHEPQHVAPMLEIASATGATFYGLVATRQLGHEPHFHWIEPRLTRDDFEKLIENSAVARAVALVQVGKREVAEQELLRAHGWLDPSTDEALISLAASFKLSSVELTAASAASLPDAPAHDGEITLNAGLYPLPNYKPENGFRVDRALFYALMRQESKFQTDALSGAGARGLMQLMPATASVIAQDRSLAGQNKDKLLDPSFNLSLAQNYLETLMASGEPRGNLFMLTSAYNGGPGNLSRWLDEINFKGDPFLFIESIPASETRGYIEQVVMNFWIYRSRMGQPAPSLDASASGSWPIYDAYESAN